MRALNRQPDWFEPLPTHRPLMDCWPGTPMRFHRAAELFRLPAAAGTDHHPQAGAGGKALRPRRWGEKSG